MKFDGILGQVGPFGPYQRRIYFLLTMVAIPSALHTFSMVFLSAKTDYWCAVPELKAFNCSNETGLADLLDGAGSCSTVLRNLSIPRELDSDTGEVHLSKCRRFNLTGLHVSNPEDVSILLSQPALELKDGTLTGKRVELGDVDEAGIYTGPTYNLSQELVEKVPFIQCDAGWVFDKSQYKNTINHQVCYVCIIIIIYVLTFISCQGRPYIMYLLIDNAVRPINTNCMM